MKMNPITMDREYRTRAGDKVRLFTVESRDATYPIVGEIRCGGQWENHTWMADGRFNEQMPQTSLDLVEIAREAEPLGVVGGTIAPLSTEQELAGLAAQHTL
jgi:hypothetical protein